PLRRLAEIDFDAILLDLNLPDACGLEAISPVSEAAPGVPIVVLSGLGDERLALQAVQRGAQDYVVKGQGDGSLLARSIRYAIERKQSEQFINYVAHHDGLTWLPNRMLLLGRLDQALARTDRHRLMRSNPHSLWPAASCSSRRAWGSACIPRTEMSRRLCCGTPTWRCTAPSGRDATRTASTLPPWTAPPPTG